MSRTYNIKKNLIFNLIKFVTQLLLQFVLRTVLIYYMGVEYLGINGLFTNIFTFLNLAELGIGSAIVFSMYKPIAENDTQKVKALQNLYKKFYLFISLIVLILGVGITPFVKVFIKEEITVDVNIYLLFVMYLINTLAGYFSAHKRSLLFAYQRNDLENKVRTICIIGMTVIQILVIILTKNYYIFFIVNIIFTIIECILIHIVANKKYPNINGKSNPLDKETKKEIIKNVAALSIHKVGSAIITSTDNILMAIFCGVTVVGVYSNYQLVTLSLVSIIGLLINAFSGSVGDLVANMSKQHVFERFKIVNFFFSYITIFISICFFVLIQPFITLWTGGTGYLLEFSTVILISISFYLSKSRVCVLIFKEGAGLFWQDRWKPIVEAIVNLTVSIVLAQFIGINGIFIGTIVSTLVAPFWVDPLVLYKHYFKRSVKEYFGRYFIDVLIMVASAIICYFVCSLIPNCGMWWLIVKFAVCIVLSNMILICAYWPTKEFKELLLMGKNFLKNKLKTTRSL